MAGAEGARKVALARRAGTGSSWRPGRGRDPWPYAGSTWAQPWERLDLCVWPATGPRPSGEASRAPLAGAAKWGKGVRGDKEGEGGRGHQAALG